MLFENKCVAASNTEKYVYKKNANCKPFGTNVGCRKKNSKISERDVARDPMGAIDLKKIFGRVLCSENRVSTSSEEFCDVVCKLKALVLIFWP